MATGILEWEHWNNYEIYFGLAAEAPGLGDVHWASSTLIIEVKDFVPYTNNDLNFDIGVAHPQYLFDQQLQLL